MPKLIELKLAELVLPPKTGKLSFDRIVVRPGINHQLSEAEVEKLLKHPDFGRYLGKGIRVIEAEEATPQTEVSPQANTGLTDLSSFTVEQTEEIINGTHDLAVLERWLGTEKRVTVRRQIQARLTAIQEGRE